MKKDIVHYVEFFSPGAFFGESWTVDIKDIDPKGIKWPANAYAFQIYEREDVVEGKKRYEGTPIKVGPMYYHPNSKVESLDEVRRNPKASKTLISNMKSNEWSHIIWSRWGNWPQPFDSKHHKVLS